MRPDELHLAFSFQLVQVGWSANEFRAAIDDAMQTMPAVGAPCAWVLSNHDIDRHVSRFGGGAVGTARGRAAALLQLALPGAVYLYNGDELGLAERRRSSGLGAAGPGLGAQRSHRARAGR